MRFSAITIILLLAAGCSAPKEKQWYKGNTHTHSLWSDGNDFPEMIVGWYKERGYDFMALSDHNILAVGEKWMSLEDIKKRQRVEGQGAYEKYQARFDNTWIDTREREGRTEVRLKRIDEYRTLFEEPGRFLVVQAEEISNSSKGSPVHVNAINLPGRTIIEGIKNEESVQELIRRNLRDIAAREKETGQPILAHLNHPNFQWAITAEQLAEVVEEQFFEVYNGHPGINHLGDANRPGDEQIWDIANTIRLARLHAEPLYGVATDDSHTYHGGDISPGRGWIMVHSEELSGNALVESMRAGDFYASTGVTLNDINYDASSRILTIQVKPEDGVTFQTRLVGTRSNYRPGQHGGASGIGEVFSEKSGTTAQFSIPDDALYARATITSSRSHPNPSFDGQREQAWTQPVGWRTSNK
ncbi:MAG: hypothetical protein KJT03_04725 [Verrucomicrobiae bacterium]|nr:hypothetical protein [Verrucomicrobiae bacterium]